MSLRNRSGIHGFNDTAYIYIQLYTYLVIPVITGTQQYVY